MTGKDASQLIEMVISDIELGLINVEDVRDLLQKIVDICSKTKPKDAEIVSVSLVDLIDQLIGLRIRQSKLDQGLKNHQELSTLRMDIADKKKEISNWLLLSI